MGEAGKCSLEVMEGPWIKGRDKWLGGEIAKNGIIYGIPGHSQDVLKLNPTNGEITRIGGPFPGPFKWLRGIQARNGYIYGLPSNADTVLKIDPSTDTVTTLGGPFLGDWKWHGGCLAPSNGCLYGVPCNAEAVLKVNPATDEVTLVGGPLPGRQKWYGGIVSDDGCIYGIPQNATGALKIDPRTDEVTVIGNLQPGGWKWHGGVKGPDGAIYGVPANSDRVLKIVPERGEAYEIGEALPREFTVRPDGDGKYKYGGAASGTDGAVYCFPSDAEKVLRIDCVTEQVTRIGGDVVLMPNNKWQNGYLARDGCVYAIPCNAGGVLRIDCATQEVSVLPWDTGRGGVDAPLGEKWEGGVVGLDGNMYCMPQHAKRVLKIVPGPGRIPCMVHCEPDHPFSIRDQIKDGSFIPGNLKEKKKEMVDCNVVCTVS